MPILNCSPIKPHYTQSFGRNDAMTATADWLENVQDYGLSERNFNDLTGVADKFSDGPLKTFVKILAIGGGAFATVKIGSAKIINNLSNNSVVGKTVFQPLTKAVHNGIEKAAEKLKASKYFGEQQKGFKALCVNSFAKGIEKVKVYGKRGAEEIEERCMSQIKDIKAKLKNKELTETMKLDYKKTIKDLTERKELAATENLIKKFTSTTAGASAGTVAVVEANRDSDGNGIADIGEHSAA